MEQRMDQQEEETFEVPRLNLRSVNGFDGGVRNGLKVHPGRHHIVYPLGCAVVVEEIGTGKPDLLWGHTNSVTCITISNNGLMIASGQKTYPGFKADAIVWDFKTRTQLHKLTLHKVNVQALAFSPSDIYLASLGGCDDGSVVVWEMETGNAICGSPAQYESAGNTLCIEFAKDNDNVFVTGGESTLRVWTLDRENRKIRPSEVNMGQIKRTILCIQMHKSNEKYFFCGTETGDILAINLETKRFQFKAPEKELYQKGVTSLAHVKDGYLLVGTGCGEVSELFFELPSDEPEEQVNSKFKDKKNMKNTTRKSKKIRSWKDDLEKNGSEAAITSIALRGNGHHFFIGSDNARMYRFSYDNSDCPGTFKCELIKTCHSARVNDIAFPQGTSDLIVTCQHEQVRVWALKTNQELRRFVVANKTCNAVAYACKGRYIPTAWADGYIRILGFKSQGARKGGQKNFEFYLVKAIEHAHQKGVTAIACTRGEGSFKIISGGGEGQVRIWAVSENGELLTNLIATLKEHKGEVSEIKITSDDRECVSSSNDGTCIIWDLSTCCRKQIVFANTLFKCVCYNDEETQIITSGTDRKVTYWEAFDGNQIRELEGAKSGSINALDVASPNIRGDEYHFAIGGDDRLLKLWTYNKGEVTHVGVGHSATITRVKISKDKKFIASVGEDGAILVWDFPDHC